MTAPWRSTRTSAAAWNKQGHLLCVASGRIAEALDDDDGALASALNYAEAWGNRGTALILLGRNQEALAAY